MASDIEGFLIGQLATNRGMSSEEVLVELSQSGGIDSLEGVELIIAAEREFGISIPDDALSSEVCRSVSALAALVSSKLAR